MNIAAENIRGIRNGLTSFSIDEELAITKGSEHYDCPENWVEIVDDALEKITERNSILKNEPPNNFSDGGLDDSDEGEDGGDEGGLDKSSTQSSLPDDDEGKGGRDEEVIQITYFQRDIN